MCIVNITLKSLRGFPFFDVPCYDHLVAYTSSESNLSVTRHFGEELPVYRIAWVHWRSKARRGLRERLRIDLEELRCDCDRDSLRA